MRPGQHTRKSSRHWRLFCPLLLLLACSDRGLTPGEGFIDVPGGRVWYQVAGSGTATPLLLLHGGPGTPSDYLLPLRRVAVDRPVVFYDQLGAGRADRNMDSSLWRVSRYVEELAVVRQTLGLEEVHILGHGWGSMLAIEYLRTNPEGVKSLVLASPIMSVKRWAADAKTLITELPEESRRAIVARKGGAAADPAYRAALIDYEKHYLSRSEPWPPHLLAALGKRNSSLYNSLWGPSEFAATGSLRDFEREDYLPELRVPVLFTAGRYDEATPATVQHYHGLLPGSKIAIFEHSAHMTMLDEPDAYANAVRRFLDEVDAGE